MKTRSIGHRHALSLAGIAAAVVGLALVGLAATASAQSGGTVKIDFPFVAGPTQCPAGAYTFDTGGGRVTLRSTDPKGATAVMMVITRLGRHDKDVEPELVFDRVNKQLLLSEIWLPNQDGYLVLSTTGDHEHRVLGGSNPRK
jgi:hypothetical protein